MYYPQWNHQTRNHLRIVSCRWLLILTAGWWAVQCRSEDAFLVEPTDYLPSLTSTGEHTLGCVVDGEAFVPDDTDDITAYYRSGVLSITATAETETFLQSFSLTLQDTTVRVQPYTLTADVSRAATLATATYDTSTDRYVDVCQYGYEDLITGTLTIRRLDQVSRIVSGTFEFVTAAEGCDTIRVTDGRFDIPYTP